MSMWTVLIIGAVALCLVAAALGTFLYLIQPAWEAFVSGALEPDPCDDDSSEY